MLRNEGKYAQSGAWVMAAMLMLGGCGDAGKKEAAAKAPAAPVKIAESGLPSGLSPQDVGKTPSGAAKEEYADGGAFEGSRGRAAEPQHPEVESAGKVQREVKLTDDVQGKWKAVKLLIKDKKNEEKNQTMTVDLGASFTLGGSALKVTVGPFLPNFVMSDAHYTSQGNELLNPAVQLLVEENGKEIFKGWAFARFPALYAFTHDAYAIQLMDGVPVATS